MPTPTTIAELCKALPDWKVEAVGNELYINPEGEQGDMMAFPYWHKKRYHKSIAAAYAAARAFEESHAPGK